MLLLSLGCLSLVSCISFLINLKRFYVPEAVYREVVLSESVSEHGKSEFKAMIEEKKSHLVK